MHEGNFKKVKIIMSPYTQPDRKPDIITKKGRFTYKLWLVSITSEHDMEFIYNSSGFTEAQASSILVKGDMLYWRHDNEGVYEEWDDVDGVRSKEHIIKRMRKYINKCSEDVLLGEVDE